MNAEQISRFKAVSARLLSGMRSIEREFSYEHPAKNLDYERIYSRIIWWLETPETVAAQKALDETFSDFVFGQIQDADAIKQKFEAFIETKKVRFLNGVRYEDPKPKPSQNEWEF